MAIQKKKSDRYIMMQKKKYSKIINKNQKFKDAFLLAYKKGDLNIFAEFLKQVEHVNDFINSPLFEGANNLEQNSREAFTNFASTLGIDSLTKQFGKELGDKLIKLQNNGKIQYLDIQQLSQLTPESIKSEQLNYLLDLFCNDNLIVGIHRTGGIVTGKEIEQNGLYLTGHLSSGIAPSYDSNIISTLDKNVSFYDNNPGMGILQTCVGGSYKNYGNKEYIDIILVSLPKELLANPENDIIIGDLPQKNLNPKYIFGHAVVNSKKNSIEDIVQNPKLSEFVYEKLGEKSSKQQINNKTEDIKNENEFLMNNFKTCNDISELPENRPIKNRILDFFASLTKRKEPSIQKEESKER